MISIHVPRVEDDGCALTACSGKGISIHVPRVEDDIKSRRHQDKLCRYFNPRPPCGGRLSDRQSEIAVRGHFNPRPPCGGRRLPPQSLLSHSQFQSTSPVWRTTEKRRRLDRKTLISIHVPRVEDDSGRGRLRRKLNISIHVPRVEDDNCHQIS